jgi:hypothetical protein
MSALMAKIYSCESKSGDYLISYYGWKQDSSSAAINNTPMIFDKLYEIVSAPEAGTHFILTLKIFVIKEWWKF